MVEPGAPEKMKSNPPGPSSTPHFLRYTIWSPHLHLTLNQTTILYTISCKDSVTIANKAVWCSGNTSAPGLVCRHFHYPKSTPKLQVAATYVRHFSLSVPKQAGGNPRKISGSIPDTGHQSFFAFFYLSSPYLFF